MIFFEIIFRAFIANIIGLYTRYYFLKAIGRGLPLKQLSGKGKDNMNNAVELTLNFIVGLTVLLIVIRGIAWVYDSYFR